MFHVQERGPWHKEQQQWGSRRTRRQGVEQKCGEVANRHDELKRQYGAVSQGKASWRPAVLTARCRCRCGRRSALG